MVSLSVSRAECSQEEFGQFPYRLMDWFLLLSRMGERYTPPAPSQRCLTHTQRTQLAQVKKHMPPIDHTQCIPGRHAFCFSYSFITQSLIGFYKHCVYEGDALKICQESKVPLGPSLRKINHGGIVKV